jgi:predicted DNA-binding antitoxin AbrB/MazE fold protein
MLLPKVCKPDILKIGKVYETTNELVMKKQNFDAIFENGFFRPLINLKFPEGQTVKIIIQSDNIPVKKSFPKTGIIAQLTANPLVICDFKPLTREEANERW